MSLTNLAEHEGALEDVKHKFVPLVMKWANEDQEIFNLMGSAAKPNKGKGPQVPGWHKVGDPGIRDPR